MKKSSGIKNSRAINFHANPYTIMLYAHILIFFHPDCTVGFGVSPNHTLRLVGYTTGRDFHPALKILFSLRQIFYSCLSLLSIGIRQLFSASAVPIAVPYSPSSGTIKFRSGNMVFIILLTCSHSGKFVSAPISIKSFISVPCAISAAV